MPVVRNGEAGLELLANNAEHFIRRTVAEEDFARGADAEVMAFDALVQQPLLALRPLTDVV